MGESSPSCRVSGEFPEALRLPISDGSYLRLLGEADSQELDDLIEANRARLARWLPWAAAQTFEDTIGFIRKTEAQVAGNDGFQTAIVCEGDIAGVIGYVGVNWQHRSTNLGYWLGEEYQGKGTMTEAVRALVDHALSVWKLNRVEIRAAVENRRSRAIPERLGFHQEGALRQAELVDGRYLDSVMYSMLAEDWSATRQARPASSL
jgi:ribosomal-protein-serine acetyltransferase